MKLDNIFPLLIMLVYMAALMFKSRNKKKTIPKAASRKIWQKTQPKRFQFPLPGLIRKLGEQLSNLRQQIRKELEKSRLRTKGSESSDALFFTQEESGLEFLWEQEKKPHPLESSATPSIPPGDSKYPEEQRHRASVQKHLKQKNTFGHSDKKPCKGLQLHNLTTLQQAVIWSEILAPPKALQEEITGKTKNC